MEFFFFFFNKAEGFPGSPVVKTLHFSAAGMDLIPGQGTKIPHDMWHGQKNKKQSRKMSLLQRFHPERQET